MTEEGKPSDSGGGFGGLVLPMGAYVMKGDEVRWLPVWDVILVALASVGVLRLLVRLRSPRCPQAAHEYLTRARSGVRRDLLPVIRCLLDRWISEVPGRTDMEWRMKVLHRRWSEPR